MKKIVIDYGGGKTEEFSLWWMIIISIISFFVLLYLFIHFNDGRKKRKRLETDGICTIVTVTEVVPYRGGKSSGRTIRVKYLVGDTIVHSSVGSNLIHKRNTQYWARYLPDKPHFVRLLYDVNKQVISVDDSLKKPSICNCKLPPR